MVVTFTESTSGVTVKDIAPGLGYKIILVKTPATFVGGTDLQTVDLTKYGARNIIGVLMFQETTAGSVVQQCAISATTGSVIGFTTAVSSGTLTITPLLPATTCIHSFIIFAY